MRLCVYVRTKEQERPRDEDSKRKRKKACFTKFKNFRPQKIQKKESKAPREKKGRRPLVVVVPSLSLLTFLNARAF